MENKSVWMKQFTSTLCDRPLGPYKEQTGCHCRQLTHLPTHPRHSPVRAKCLREFGLTPIKGAGVAVLDARSQPHGHGRYQRQEIQLLSWLMKHTANTPSPHTHFTTFAPLHARAFLCVCCLLFWAGRRPFGLIATKCCTPVRLHDIYLSAVARYFCRTGWGGGAHS